jgi:Replication stress response SDE2 C-terminal
VGLKAGGTAEQRAARLVLLRDTPLDKLDRKHFAKGVLPAVRCRLLHMCIWPHWGIMPPCVLGPNAALG